MHHHALAVWAAHQLAEIAPPHHRAAPAAQAGAEAFVPAGRAIYQAAGAGGLGGRRGEGGKEVVAHSTTHRTRCAATHSANSAPASTGASQGASRVARTWRGSCRHLEQRRHQCVGLGPRVELRRPVLIAGERRGHGFLAAE